VNASAHPEAVIFAMWDKDPKPMVFSSLYPGILGRPSAAPQDAKHPFAKKPNARMLCIDWPYQQGQNWTPVAELAGCYDVCATTALDEGAVDVHVATGPTIRRYQHGTHDHGTHGKEHLVQQWESRATPGYTVTAVRATARPKKGSGHAAVMFGVFEWAAYGLCEVAPGQSVIPRETVHAAEHFEIMACYVDKDGRGQQFYVHPPWKGQQGNVVPLSPQAWETVAGMSADADYLWVFRAGALAFATHAEIRQAGGMQNNVPWTVYDMPQIARGNVRDVQERLFKGVRDLSYCADGTLTIVYHDVHEDEMPQLRTQQSDHVLARMTERLWTSTPQVRVHPDGRRELIVKATTGGGHHETTTTHGWTRLDGNEAARRVHRTPIHCWPVLDALSRMVGPKAPALTH
jgi:hypothetical protein